MARSRTLVLKNKVEVTGADQLKSLGDRLKGALNPTNVAKGLAGGFIASEAFQFFDSAINKAAEFQDTVGATGVIIGQELQAPMEAWAETASSAFGASKQQALAAANQMAVFGKAAGLAGDDLATFATDMTQLGGDLASFFGGSTEDAITAVGSALRGEFEPIRRYGVLLDDATLRQKAFEMGLIDSTKNALTPQQRTLAAQAAILEQTSDAQGDFARTSDGMANTQRRLQAELENVTLEIGEKLLPIGLAFAKFVSDTLIPALQFLTDNVIGPMIDGLGNIGQSFREAAGDIHFFAMNFGEQGDRVHAVADRFGIEFDDLKDRVRDRMVETGESFDEAMTFIEDEARNTAAELPKTMDEGMRATHQVVRDIGAEIAAEWEGVSERIPQAIRDRWDDTRRAAFQIAVEHAKGILDAQDQVKVAFEALTQLQEEEQTRAQRISYLQGKLSSQQLQDALNDSRPGVQGAARALVSQVTAELAALGVNAYSFGVNTGNELARGLNTRYGVVRDAAGRLAQAAVGQIGIRSEPKDADSPLRGITKFGGNLVDTYAEGMRARIASLRSVAAQVAAAATPSGIGALSPALVGAAPMPGGGGTTVINNNFTFHGEPSRKEDDLTDLLQALTALGGGSVRYG